MGLDSVIVMAGHKELKLADHCSKIDGEVLKKTLLKLVEHIKSLGLHDTDHVEAESVFPFRKAK